MVAGVDGVVRETDAGRSILTAPSGNGHYRFRSPPPEGWQGNLRRLGVFSGAVMESSGVVCTSMVFWNNAVTGVTAEYRA